MSESTPGLMLWVWLIGAPMLALFYDMVRTPSRRSPSDGRAGLL